MPYSSIRFRRSTGFQLAGSVSSIVGGDEGGNSFQPAWAIAGKRKADELPRIHFCCPDVGSIVTCGTRPPHFLETRDVQRSSGSVTCVSASMTLMRSVTACAMAAPLLLLRCLRPPIVGRGGAFAASIA